MRTVAIIQARMGSTRLPGKVSLPLAGRPMLEHVIRRVQAAPGVDAVCVATTTHERDTPLVALAESFGAATFRGSEDDVLSRYAGAAKAFAADVIVRVTSDCPLFDAGVLGAMLAEFGRRRAELDYLSNTIERTYPRGLDAEVFTAEALHRAAAEATDPRAREHVTWHLYNHPADYRLAAYRDPLGRNRADLRWTVDTPEDFEMVRRVYEALDTGGAPFSYDATLAFIDAHPEVAALNAHVEQKKL